MCQRRRPGRCWTTPAMRISSTNRPVSASKSPAVAATCEPGAPQAVAVGTMTCVDVKQIWG